MATIWKGALTFGLVNIPVEMRTAVQSDHVSFRMLNGADLTPVKHERVDRHGAPVAWKDVVKGYEYEKGRFVVITDEDFRSAALESSKTIDICDFVQEREIDARFFETPYFLLPSKGGEKAYALLREAVRNAGVVGIGKVTMRQTQHLAGIKVVGDALVLEIMRFASELVDADEYSFPDASLVRPQELAMAEQLVQNLAEPFDPSKYTDDYRASLMRVIQAKLQGKRVASRSADDGAADGKVLDLMARLQASLGQASSRSAATKRSATKRSATKPAATKRAPAKRAPRAATPKKTSRAAGARPAGRKKSA
ncbi:MAG: non-homologous end joining protein Ku [Gemmatirosa sp.]